MLHWKRTLITPAQLHYDVYCWRPVRGWQAWLCIRQVCQTVLALAALPSLKYIEIIATTVQRKETQAIHFIFYFDPSTCGLLYPPQLKKDLSIPSY